jgi:predicted nucleic acid-binding protein
VKLYLDSVVVIYLIEQPPAFGPTASAAVAGLNPTALVGTDLTRMECLIHPRRSNDTVREADFERFFQQKYLPFQPLNFAVLDTATNLRAKYRFLKTPDALHLAAAITAGCDLFVTNDVQLVNVTEIRVVTI